MLNPTTLNTELLKIMDDNNPNFLGFPSDNFEMATNWGNAIFNYAKDVIPTSLTATQSKDAFIGVMQTMTIPTGLAIFPLAFTSFALTLAGGMQPLFTGVPPPIPIILLPVFVLPFETPIEARVAAMTAIIDLWFRTGTAINNTSGVTTIWS